jgi:hypothetical protein
MATWRRPPVPAPPALSPEPPDPPPPTQMTSEWWDDDDDDPLLDHVLHILYPVQSMFRRVRESLRDSGYVQFDHLFTLDEECI